MANTLQRIDANPIDTHGSECRAIMVVRNEALRLPWVLAYHRKLGIRRFFIIDNGSEDGTLAFLKEQADCHVYSTTDSFAAANCGLVWQQEILDQHGEGHWWLIIDADEMLVYPGSETVSLPEFCAYLDSIEAEGLYTAFIDMYSRGPVAEAAYAPGQSFLGTCPYFDSEYKFRPRLGLPFGGKPFPAIEPIGGPRLRRFYPGFRRGGVLAIALVKILRRARNLLNRFGIRLPINCAVPPILFKVPLFKWTPDLKLINSHVTSPMRLAPVTGALLHFKFFADFHKRIMQEVARGEHFDGASEYARYLRAIESEPRMSFFYAKSVMYKNTDDLLGLGLIRDDASYAAFRSRLTDKVRKQA